MIPKKFLYATSILIGTIIGAGIFGIPYVIEKSGILPGFFYFLILGILVVFIHLFFGEIILRTKENCRLIGLGQKYLGSFGKNLIMISVIVGVNGALLAYLIIGGEFLKILFGNLLNFSGFQFTLFFWIFLSYFIFRGIKLIAPAEMITNFIFFSVIVVILLFCLPEVNLSNISIFNLSNAFLPFGVILFSLIGWQAIPEICSFLKNPKEKKKIKKIIIFSLIVVIAIYLFFSLAVIGVAGKNVTEDTLSGLIQFLGPKIVFLIALAALITLADSFLILGLYLRNTFIYDLKVSKNLATLFSCGFPLLLFLAGLRSFIGILGFVGTIVGLIEGTIIILIFKKSKVLGNREPEYSLKIPTLLLYFLIILLFLGALSQLFLYK